jgi:GNAT superfamily N-acetyltransferase
MSEASYKVVTYPGSELPEAYRNLIFSKWMRSLRFGNEYYKLIDSDAYYSTYHKYIEMLLNRPTTSVNLAVLADEPDTALGWSVTEPGILHFIHVQRELRKQGIGKALTPPDTTVITHVTKIGLSLWPTKLPNARFNPFA